MSEPKSEPALYHPNERWEVATLPDREMAVTFAVAHFVAVAVEAIAERGLFSVALSGGSTPKEIYRHLADPEIAKLVDWSRVMLFWSDERTVPPDHLESNYRMAMEAGLGNLSIPEGQIFRMHAESDLEVNAAAYEHVLRDKVDGILDLTMLGMGSDGHTASLFPDSAALAEEKRLVIPNQITPDNWRMTFTFPCINASRRTAIYVLGEEKREMLDAVLHGPQEYPIQQVGTEERPALWITDVNTGD